MTYNPGIPNSTDLISASQQPIKDNFGQLNTQFGIDHVPFNNGGSNGTGHHLKVQIDTPLGADPAQAGVTGAFYTKSDGTRAQAFFNNGANVFQLTSGAVNYAIAPTISASGLTFNGVSSVGKYYLCGGVVFFFVSITCTSITGAATGFLEISLPVNSTSGGGSGSLTQYQTGTIIKSTNGTIGTSASVMVMPWAPVATATAQTFIGNGFYF